MNSTIAAIATSGGSGAVNIVRLSGMRSLCIAQKITRKKEFKPRFAHLCTLYDTQNEVVDEVLVIYFKAPFSFTGEEVVEFQCHGGVIIAQQILQLLCFEGASLAKPGEFVQRAFLNGKMDLSQVQAIASMINAKSQKATKLLARQLKGELQKYCEEVRQKILKALAFSEVSIDYATDDLPEDLMQNLRNQLLCLRNELFDLAQKSEQRKGVFEGFKVAIVGKPNVGKSSILNTLLSYDRSIVSSQAGTTRDTIEARMQIRGHHIDIIDTAGIRKNSGEIEALGIQRSLQAVREADIVIAVFDSSRAFDVEDEVILDLYKTQQKLKILLLNKTDLPLRNDFDFSYFRPISISAINGAQVVLNKLEKMLNEFDFDQILLSSTFQVQAVQACAKEIEQATEVLASEELELFSFHLNVALTHIASITKPYTYEQILDKMFGEFCLGK